ncbi:MAG: rRNA ((1518)-N(6)/adenine(1519)-N(6))-dimethyltransferase RsmA [Armatimonadota bacterium]
MSNIGPDISKPSGLTAVLQRHGIGLSKSMGQHFLIDKNHLGKIVAAAGIQPTDTILEIGPGAGVMTRLLSAEAAKVFTIELDHRMIAVLDETLADLDNVIVVQGDALSTDWGIAFAEDTSTRLVANIPYQITSPLLIRILESDPPFIHATILVQKEVAERVVAPAGSKVYGALSCVAQFVCDCHISSVVPRGVFYPPPKVDSAVLNLHPHNRHHGISINEFTRITRAAFNQRRKTLRNSLTSGLGWSDTDLYAVLDQASVPSDTRPEQLSVDQFCEIARAAKARDI